jgi:excisionase family DNA binding protein
MNELIAEAREVCTTSEAARQLGVSNTTIQIMVERGELKAWRTRGGHRRISLESLDAVQRMRSAGMARRPGEDEPLTVLVVEDDAALRELYVSTIESWGWPVQVITAADGIDALLMIERRRPEILITDLRMAPMDGFDFLRKLRTHHEFNGTNVIVVTGLDEGAIAAKGTLPPGIVVYGKPVPFDKIEGFIEALMLRRSLGRG